jgi:hypothetical protein
LVGLYRFLKLETDLLVPTAQKGTNMTNLIFLIAFVASLMFMVFTVRKLKKEFANYLIILKDQIHKDKDEAVKSLDKCIAIMREK